MKILIIEDNELNRKLLWALLRPKGFDLEEAQTAFEAIAILGRSPPPDVILLDINVPGGGLSVAAHVAATPALAGITVIALTALAMQGDRERFLAAGCHGYLSKPIDVRTFTAQVEQIVRARK